METALLHAIKLVEWWVESIEIVGRIVNSFLGTRSMTGI